MFRWLTDRLPAAKRRAKAAAEYEAHCDARIAAVRELAKRGWREWLHQSPYGYGGLIETVRLEEWIAGSWNRQPMRYSDAPPWWNVADVWWRPAEGETIDAMAEPGDVFINSQRQFLQFVRQRNNRTFSPSLLRTYGSEPMRRYSCPFQTTQDEIVAQVGAPLRP